METVDLGRTVWHAERRKGKAVTIPFCRGRRAGGSPIRLDEMFFFLLLTYLSIFRCNDLSFSQSWVCGGGLVRAHIITYHQLAMTLNTGLAVEATDCVVSAVA